MILTDRDIEQMAWQADLIEPYDPALLQPASYDMRLDGIFRFYNPSDSRTIDTKSSEGRTTIVEVQESITIDSLSFVLASTIEKVKIPDSMVGRIEGKSSLARMGLFVHVTAGFCDPGFEGHVTLELFNANHQPIKIYVGMPICQMAFERLSAHSRKPYSGKYQNQPRGPQESTYYRNFPNE